MTVKELIEALQKMPPDAEVKMYSTEDIYEESGGYTSELYRAIGSVEMGDDRGRRIEQIADIISRWDQDHEHATQCAEKICYLFEADC